MTTSLPFTDEQVVESFAPQAVVLPKLGQGSFKVAYLTRVNDEDRVLKIIYSYPVEGDQEEFELEATPARIAREIEGMSSVSSPHVVTLLSQPVLVPIGKAQFVCFEEPFYSGGTLEDLLRHRMLSRVEQRGLLVAMLSAVSAMWDQASIVHRDIKPGNIAFDVAERPILLDLGIVLFTELSDITESGAVSPATPKYSAPEQFDVRRNAVVDHRTDQFQIGIALVEAATGAHPFWHSGVTQWDYLQATERFSKDMLDSAEMDDDVKAVVSRLLAPRIYNRYRHPDIALGELGISL
jgi:serine/threonine protein kinase